MKNKNIKLTILIIGILILILFYCIQSKDMAEDINRNT